MIELYCIFIHFYYYYNIVKYFYFIILFELFIMEQMGLQSVTLMVVLEEN